MGKKGKHTTFAARMHQCQTTELRTLEGAIRSRRLRLYSEISSALEVQQACQARWGLVLVERPSCSLRAWEMETACLVASVDSHREWEMRMACPVVSVALVACPVALATLRTSSRDS